MIGFDTNIVVRFLAQDEPTQSRLAMQLIGSLTEENPGFISVAAMLETVWVLERSYGFTDGEIAIALESMLAAPVLAIECEVQVFTAMTVLREGHGSFGDALIGALGANAGCVSTYTFDRKAARLPGFELL